MTETTEFVSPVAHIGQEVMFYSNGTKENGSQPWPAKVVRGNSGETINRMVGLVLYHGARKDTVRHVSDPKLSDPNMRAAGAWDYCEHDQETKKMLHEMRGHVGRIVACEKRIDEKLAKLTAKGGSAEGLKEKAE